MINKREILDAASNLNLNPHILEKDYALGWALAIASVASLEGAEDTANDLLHRADKALYAAER